MRRIVREVLSFPPRSKSPFSLLLLIGVFLWNRGRTDAFLSSPVRPGVVSTDRSFRLASSNGDGDPTAEPEETSMRCPKDDDSSSLGIVATTLEGRLLCASECAYTIEAPYAKGAAFVAGSQIRRISLGVNSCIVGSTQDGIVVAFRGTQGGSPLDWLQNAALFLESVPRTFAPRGCKVHGGFYGAISSKLGRSVEQAVLEFVANNPNNKPRVYLTGHSKGGSLASLFALRMHQDPKLPNPQGVYTFGAAKVGNDAFATYYDSLIPQTTYENDLDIIPFLPPGQNTMDDMMETLEDPDKMMEAMDRIFWSETDVKLLKNKSWGPDGKKNQPYNSWKYQFLGHRVFLKDAAAITPVTRDLDIQRIRDIESKTLWNFKEFARAHCSACFDSQTNCGGGYFGALASEVCATAAASTCRQTDTTDGDPSEESDNDNDRWKAQTLQQVYF